MKYFTRELYDKTQSVYSQEELSDDQIDRLEDEIDLLWNEVKKRYADYVMSIKNRFPKNIQKINNISFHDGIVKSFSENSQHEIRLHIDGSNCCWAPQKNYIVVFRKVKNFKGLEKIENDIWLYEEIDIDEKGDFWFRVLLEKSEFSIIAGDIELLTE